MSENREAILKRTKLANIFHRKNSLDPKDDKKGEEIPFKDFITFDIRLRIPDVETQLLHRAVKL